MASREQGCNFPLLLLALAFPGVHSLLTLIAETLRLNFSAEFRMLTPSPRLTIHRRILQANLNVACFYGCISLSVAGSEVSLPISSRCLFRRFFTFCLFIFSFSLSLFCFVFFYSFIFLSHIELRREILPFSLYTYPSLTTVKRSYCQCWYNKYTSVLVLGWTTLLKRH